MMMTSVMLVIILVALATALPSPSQDDHGSSCHAPVHSFGDECYSSTKVQRAPGETLKYHITAAASVEICCKVETCLTSSCTMKDIGCGHHSLESESLPWEGEHTLDTPKVECKTTGVHAVYYSFTTSH